MLIINPFNAVTLSKNLGANQRKILFFLKPGILGHFASYSPSKMTKCKTLTG